MSNLDPSPKPVLWQDVAVGERVYPSPDSNDWFEKIRPDRGRNARGRTGLKIYIYPRTEVWRK